MANQKKGSNSVKKTENKAPVKVIVAKEKKVKGDKKEREINTELIFIEDGTFFNELGKQITNKKNIDDFSFGDAANSPCKVKIRQRDNSWAIKTTSKRGDIKGNAGDYLMIDPLGNKLKVSEAMFQKLHVNIFGE